jgi:cytochrome c oxidase subunit IV
MAHAHESNTKRIWTVFGLLSVITTVEVAFGIIKPHALYHNTILRMNILNWIFIILTIVKAYYIMWAFMHLEGEKKSLRWSVVAPLVFLILYLCFIILVEADYVFEVFKNSHYKWIF